MLQTTEARTEYVDFWNEVLVPKFVKWRHIIVDGLTHHSEAVFPRLEVSPGDRAVDVGCGFGDTAIKLARRVGPSGRVLGLDCCDAFLEHGRRDAAAIARAPALRRAGPLRSVAGAAPRLRASDPRGTIRRFTRVA